MTASVHRSGRTNVFRPAYVLLGIALLALMAYTLRMAFYLPVYSDETYWHLIWSRLTADDGQLVYLFSQCAQGQWLKAPLSWLPAMSLGSLLYEDASHPWVLRLYGWYLFVLLLPIWIWLLKRQTGLGWFDSTLAVLAFFSVGVLPFLMVYDRPEKSLLILLTLVLVLVPARPMAKQKHSGLRNGLWVTVFSLIGLLLAAIHPKALFLFPILLAASYLRTGSWVAVLVLAGVLGWASIETMAIWSQRTNCPEFPGLMQTLHGLTLRPGDFFSDPWEFMKASAANFLASGAYIDSIAIAPQYVENWLPEQSNNSPSQAWLTALNALNWIPIGIAIALTAVNISQAKVAWYRSTGLIWLTLFIALLGIICLQTAKNFYEASLMWPLLFLLVIYSFSKPTSKTHPKAVKYIVLVLVLIGIISSIMRLERFDSFLAQWKADRVWQRENMDAYNESLRNFASQQCLVTPHAERLAIDAKTYPAFWQHRQPILLDFSAGWWAAEADLAVTLRERQSEGLIADCRQLPDKLRRLARTQGDICCLSAEDMR